MIRKLRDHYALWLLFVAWSCICVAIGIAIETVEAQRQVTDAFQRFAIQQVQHGATPVSMRGADNGTQSVPTISRQAVE